MPQHRYAQLILVLSLLTTATACVSVGKTVLMPGLEPVPIQDVQVFLEDDTVPEHERVAILEADFNDTMSDGTDVLNKLREAAAELGANAIIIVGSEAEGDAERALRTLTTGAYLGGRAKVRAFAVIIRRP